MTSQPSDPATPRFRLAVIDDHPLVRQGIVETLSDDHAFDVVGAGGSADEGVAIARELQPDLIFLDVNLPGGGVDAARRIHAAMPRVKIAMFSFRQDLAIVRACLTAGACGYLVKGISGSQLRRVTHALIAGETVIDAEVARRLEQDGPGGERALE